MENKNAETELQQYAEHINHELIRLNYNLADVSNQCRYIRFMLWIFFAAIVIINIVAAV